MEHIEGAQVGGKTDKEVAEDDESGEHSEGSDDDSGEDSDDDSGEDSDDDSGEDSDDDSGEDSDGESGVDITKERAESNSAMPPSMPPAAPPTISPTIPPAITLQKKGACCCGCGLDASSSNHYCIYTKKG